MNRSGGKRQPAGRRLLAGVVVLLMMAWAGAASAARLEVVGVDEAMAENIRAYVGEPPTEDDAATVGIYAQRARSEARRALESQGYYRAEITIEQSSDADGRVVTIIAEPGRPVRLNDIRVEVRGEAADDPAFDALRRSLPLNKDDILDHGTYQTAKQAIRNLALNRGYFEGEYLVHRVEVDTAAYTADVALVFDSGPRYRFGDVSFSGTPFRRSLLKRFLTFAPEEPYSASAVARLNRRLLDSGYFSDVRVRTEREGAPSGQVPVGIDLETRDPNQVGFGVGFSTDVGPRVRLNWDKPWLNERGHQLFNEIQLSQVQQSVSTKYRIPMEKPGSDYLQLQAGWLSESFADTRTEQYTAAVQFEKLLESGWNRALYVRWQQDRFTQGEDEGRTTLVLPGVSYRRTRSRGGLDPNWGDAQSATLEFSEPFVGSDIDLIRLLGSTRWLRSLGSRHQFLFRLTGGALLASEFDRVPASLRFFAGGDQSVRGYGYQRLAPEEDGEFVGGKYLTTGSVEYGYRFLEQWRGAVFVDAGNAYSEPNPRVFVGTGFGIRWISPVGPVRLDLAWAVDREGKPLRLHFSMGPPL
ncbi:outer membrane protein assembly factor [Ectothiorhodospiraceae bacterium WFHF3C12]|nr:outer membrane protein assembly factor [Ectothiorhodospiraceae bacterium WFHF3C12]